ncbi:hypothetical protein OCU04_010079 [Sclerotinia nivalis]|uniref:Uncharacterized protein n=1 Tax=Sclerotinia nivalis TaxID=352851 RepID=A0A9X0ADZ9_9HELO|nr:hypothetical protein OCU04_010079 [Sclerotinia nivalis]
MMHARLSVGLEHAAAVTRESELREREKSVCWMEMSLRRKGKADKQAKMIHITRSRFMENVGVDLDGQCVQFEGGSIFGMRALSGNGLLVISGWARMVGAGRKVDD